MSRIDIEIVAVPIIRMGTTDLLTRAAETPRLSVSHLLNESSKVDVDGKMSANSYSLRLTAHQIPNLGQVPAARMPVHTRSG